MKNKVSLILFVVITLIVSSLFAIDAKAGKIDNTYFRYIANKCSTVKWTKYDVWSSSFGQSRVKYYKMVRKDKVTCGDYDKGLSIYCAYQKNPSNLKPKDMNDIKYYRHDVEDLATFQPYAKKRVKNGTITRTDLGDHIRGIIVNSATYLSIDTVKANFKKWCQNNKDCNKKLNKGTIKIGEIDGPLIRSAAQAAVWSYANGNANRKIKCHKGKSCSKKELATANEMFDWYRGRRLSQKDAKFSITADYPKYKSGVVTITFTIKGVALSNLNVTNPVCSNGVKCSIKKIDGKFALVAETGTNKKFDYSVTVTGKQKQMPVAYIPYDTKCEKKKVCVKYNKKGKCKKKEKRKVCKEVVTKNQEYVGEPTDNPVPFSQVFKNKYEPDVIDLSCAPIKPKKVPCKKGETTKSDGNVLNNVQTNEDTIKKIITADPDKYSEESIKKCKNTYCKNGVCCNISVDVTEYNGGQYTVTPLGEDGKEVVVIGTKIVFSKNKDNVTSCIRNFAKIVVTKKCYKQGTSCPTTDQSKIENCNDLSAKLRIGLDNSKNTVDWDEIALTKKEDTSQAKNSCSNASSKNGYSVRTIKKVYNFKMSDQAYKDQGITNPDDNCYSYTVKKVPQSAAFVDLKVNYCGNQSTSESSSCTVPKDAPCPLNDPCLRECDYAKKLGAKCVAVDQATLKANCPKCCENGKCENDGGGGSEKLYDLKNIYYRTIDTENVFPTSTGTKSSVWYKEASSIQLIAEANNKIQLSQPDTYSGTPQYSVQLTPEMMSEIRDYNEKAGKSYTKTGHLQTFIDEVSGTSKGKGFTITRGGSN